MERHEIRDPDWYREEADRVRLKAATASDPVLRDSYLQLAQAYEHLAASLERARPR